MYYLGVDPGKDKVGLAIVNQELEFVEGLLIKSVEFASMIKRLQEKYKYEKILLGNGTYYQNFLAILKKMSLEYKIIDETNSTLAARQKYWEYNPPRGIRRLLPTSLQSPPQEIDDYAAFIIATRYLND